jgi:hypothetical protein
MADINYIPQVDYTSKDYVAIRDDMLGQIPDLFPNWTNRDPADFGIVLIELFAYMGDILNYYIDRSANEAFMTTASQRDSVLYLARLLGYNPTTVVASKVTLTFYNANDVTKEVPAGTQIATSASTTGGTQIIFETDSAITIPAKVGTVNGTITVTATQGQTVSETLDPKSTGEINQVRELTYSPLIQNSIDILAGASPFTEVSYLIDYNNYDPVFVVQTNADGVSFVVFGDGISGRIPAPDAILTATYRIGGGTIGNVGAGLIKSIIKSSVPLSSFSGVTVTNLTAATGGAEEESTDSIRVNAPNSIRALNRAVSLADYSALCVEAGVAKANAVADVYTSVTVYVAPSAGELGVTSISGTTPSSQFTGTTVPLLTSYLVGKVPANTTVTFQPPTYVPVSIVATITTLPQYKNSLVSTAVNSVVSELLAFDNVFFQDRLTLNDLMSTITSVEGVAYVQVEKLVRAQAGYDFTYTITNKAASGTVATITVGTHSLTVGSTVKVTGVDTTFNGTFVVTAVAATTFSYALVSAVVSSTATSGSVTRLTTNDIICSENEIPYLDTASLSLTVLGGIVN